MLGGQTREIGGRGRGRGETQERPNRLSFCRVPNLCVMNWNVIGSAKHTLTSQETDLRLESRMVFFTLGKYCLCFVLRAF